MNSKQRKVVRTILAWYHHRGRTLPWRNITNPYRILISEIMLQQTQVRRVLVKYPEFQRRFPTLRSLANAKQKEVVHAWRGMGYNNRAVRLHKLALTVVRDHRGRIPQDFDALIALPGIGKYTANAMLSSAFGKQLPIVDVNVQRVFSRLFWRMKSTGTMRSVHEIWEWAEHILPKQNAYDWNQALMDLGGTICTARNPNCPECPATKLCSSRIGMKKENGNRPKREPSLEGVPNRLYRGKIVEQLRQLNGVRSIRTTELAKMIHPGFSKKNEPWLKKLISGLEKDGLIRVNGNGDFATSRVSLA